MVSVLPLILVTICLLDYAELLMKSTDIIFTVISARSGQRKRYSYTSKDPPLNLCEKSDNVTFLLHGWSQDMTTAVYAKPLIDNMLEYRRGCVICMEYSDYSRDYGYLTLPTTYEFVSKALAEQVVALKNRGLNMNNGRLWGFSYGARVVVNAGVMLSRQGIVLSNIDAVDPAGPGFDYLPVFKRDIKSAARNVQCHHCSISFGTRERDGTCHQNIIYGDCGEKQPGSSTQPGYGDHGMCAIFYCQSFKKNYEPQPNKKSTCLFAGKAGDLARARARGYRIGPIQINDGSMNGVFYVQP